MLHSTRPQTRDAILKLSRKSRERQRYRIAAVLDPTNAATSVAPQRTDRVPDTMDFTKLLSRLARARGSVERSLELIEADAMDESAAEWAAGILDTIQQFGPLLRQHEQLVSALVPCKPDGRKRGSDSKPSRRLQLEQVPRQLKSGLALITKNVRDLPTSSYDLRPTPEELEDAKREISRIRRACQGIRRKFRTHGVKG